MKTNTVIPIAAGAATTRYGPRRQAKRDATFGFLSSREMQHPLHAFTPSSIRTGAGRYVRLLAALFLTCSHWLFPVSSHAQDFNLDTDYRNYWVAPNLGVGPFEHYFETNTQASSAVYNGSVLDNSTNKNELLYSNLVEMLPNDGNIGLYWSSLGQPAVSILSDVAIGDVISPPPGFTTNIPPANFTAVQVGDNPAAYYMSPDGGAFYVPSTGFIIAAQPNNTTIVWTNRIGAAGYSRTQVINVSAVSTRRPSKLFWTEEPYDAPVVSLAGLFPAIHYNSEVPPPVTNIVTTTNGGFVTTATNIVSGVWLDSQKQLHAKGVTGTFLIEYFRDGTYSDQVQPLGVEVVRVVAPDVQLLTASMGQRLLPSDTYWGSADGINGVIPDTSQSDSSAILVYGQDGPKKNWAFPLRRTWMDPWSLTIYWKQTGLMGVQWPYEVDWYSVDWPAHPQLFILGENIDQGRLSALIPSELTARLISDMDPPLSARLSDSGRSFTHLLPGYSMIQYQNQTNIWFDVIRAVSHTNTAVFDLQPVPAEIGQELNPGDENAHALWFDADQAYVLGGQAYLNKLAQWTLSFWFSADKLQNATLYSEGTTNQANLNVNITTNGQVQVQIRNSGNNQWVTFSTANAPVRSNFWQHLTMTFDDAIPGTGLLQVYLDDDVEFTNTMPRVQFTEEDQSVWAAESVSPIANFFRGKLDEVRMWSVVLDSEQISSNRFNATPEPQANLSAWFPCDEGQGLVVYNYGGSRNATVYNALWTYGQAIPVDDWAGYPGYLHLAEGDRYNVGYYNYPTEANPDNESHIFAVNTGELEVWWANQSRNTDMPRVYYPSRVVRYTNFWPSNPSQIVIASGLGSDGEQPAGSETWDPLQALDPTVYYQNDSSLDGYNPNEEHALVLDGVVYALRDDLNLTNSSDPYVLVDYTQASNNAPAMHVFQVVETNAEYRFEQPLQAGLPIIPILPLGAFPPALSTESDNKPPAWQDRKLEWWAVAAGNDGGTTNTVMRFYYTMQPGFYFPGLSADSQPQIGSEVPWLSGSDTGTPIAFTYHISWPTNVPTLHLGQTLTLPQNGLPDVWDQLSVEIPYEQSSNQIPAQASVRLFDPLQAHTNYLDSAVIDAMTSAGMARIDVASGLVRFPNLPPSLYPRLYYDKTTSLLVLEGQQVKTLTGAGYLLLNELESFEQEAVEATAEGIDGTLKDKWNTAVEGFPTDITPIDPNQPYVKAALGARLSEGVGYVTLAFNNSTNMQQVPSASPISLSIIQVDTNLYSGELEVIQPPDVLAEQLSLRVSADFSGLADQCEFRWRSVDPVGGLPPNTPYEQWQTYGTDPSVGTNEVTISGASQFTLSDHYFAVQYRPTNTFGPSGTNWSDWTYKLAPGWVVRAMTGINPFMQTFPDMLNNAVDTRSTMISEAGGPYEGDIALNLDAANAAGLIPTYETIFHRAMEFSLLAGVANDDINQTLLFAASRLNDLYDLLGNEAFADGEDPTVPYPQDLSTAGNFLGANGASLFAFMNQEPNELEEELALLRGRDDTLEPSVQTSPLYNRLIWNFTAGINGGEPAYAYIYNIHGDPSNTDGTITAEDARRLYPQGHGDAWGHYLSAIQHYYGLLSYPLFKWGTEPGATLVNSSATVSVDYYDEQKFAETAAALARTGAQIVQDTFREQYSENADGLQPGYHDSNTNRAWGIGDWASRAGQSALYDWATANSLMLTTLTNLTQINPQAESRPPEGIEKIDRDSTPELSEITAQYKVIQQTADNANGGLNPLGLVRGEVPFDIDPSQIDAGETHFEQIYDRALQAVLNSVVAFDNARTVSEQLRQQYNSVYDLAESLSAQETDYHNRLIEVYGYPYSDDIGPGKTYPQGYDGPDLINWQIVDLDNLVANVPTNTQTLNVDVYDLGFSANTGFGGKLYTDYTDLTGTRTNGLTNTISITVNDDGLKVKPNGWTGSRRAQGELQLAIADYIQKWYDLEAKKTEYDQTMQELENEVSHRIADYGRIAGEAGEWPNTISTKNYKITINKILTGLKVLAGDWVIRARMSSSKALAANGIFPQQVAGFIGPYPVAQVNNPFGGPEIEALVVAAQLEAQTAAVYENANYFFGTIGDIAEQALQNQISNNSFRSQLKWPTLETEVNLQNQYVKLAELQSKVEALQQSQQKIQNLLTEGERLLFERGQIRSRIAQRIQLARYGDLDLRIFRNDALRRYQSTFDLAARYVYMAAKAYDYETGLLSTDNNLTPGSKFLEDVVRARLPGRFSSWLAMPLPGTTGSGEPGLADVLARMKADWDVVKGRFGFNNPETETSRFSLRTELFRTAPDTSGDAAWAQMLENSMVPDLNQVTEFRRYCRPFSDSTNVEPGIVVTFPSYVMARKNFFGIDLAGGDNAYDASHASTKIRSVGVWFTNYNNTNGAAGALANEPRVYLIPVGMDILRSPTGDATSTRSYNVFDQAIPLPYNIGGADIDNPDWSPVVDSLQEPFGQIRQFASFRAYHDSGNFDPSETITASRLIGRSVWNTEWMLIIPGSTLLNDPEEGIERFIYGGLVNGKRDGNGVKDIKIFFQTYSISGD